MYGSTVRSLEIFLCYKHPHFSLLLSDNDALLMLATSSNHVPKTWLLIGHYGLSLQLQTQLSALQQQYSAKVSEREALQAKNELVSAQLERAEVLTNSLAAEQVRQCCYLHQYKWLCKLRRVCKTPVRGCQRVGWNWDWDHQVVVCGVESIQNYVHCIKPQHKTEFQS